MLLQDVNVRHPLDAWMYAALHCFCWARCMDLQTSLVKEWSFAHESVDMAAQPVGRGRVPVYR